MWRALLPDAAEVAPDLELAALARELEMTGGYIKNAVLRAAYLAADRGTPITNALLRRAARAECEAMGKLVGAAC